MAPQPLGAKKQAMHLSIAWITSKTKAPKSCNGYFRRRKATRPAKPLTKPKAREEGSGTVVRANVALSEMDAPGAFWAKVIVKVDGWPVIAPPLNVPLL